MTKKPIEGEHKRTPLNLVSLHEFIEGIRFTPRRREVEPIGVGVVYEDGAVILHTGTKHHDLSDLDESDHERIISLFKETAFKAQWRFNYFDG